jgi:hypothetical protein
MKYLIIIGLILLVLALIYWRLRPYLLTGWKVYKIFRQMQKEQVNGLPNNNLPQKVAKNQMMVRCESCGKWLTSDRAIKIGNNKQSYCSTSCLEKVAVS